MRVRAGDNTQVVVLPIDRLQSSVTVERDRQQAASDRYRVGISLNVPNLFNQPVYSGFSGIMTSPFFLEPTTASGVRRVTLSTNVSF